MTITENSPETKKIKAMKNYVALIGFIKEKAKNTNLSKENEKEFLDSFYNELKEEISEKFSFNDERVVKRVILKAVILNEIRDDFAD